MKYVMAQPAVPRFEWEVKVAIYGLLKAGVLKEDIVILFSRHEESVISEIKNIDVNVHVYSDDRVDFEYIPSIKPYLMYRYLEEDVSRENETYFFMDSDVIVKEQPETDSHLRGVWYGSDCGGYLNYDYIVQCDNGFNILKDMSEIVGVSIEDIKSMNNDSIGAQYIMSKPSSEYFKKVYEDSIKLWKYIKDKDTNYQKWCQEMVATLWNMPLFDVMPRAKKEMEFTWATDSIEKWNKNKIYHNAGVTQDMKDMFFKGDYINKDPFNEDFSHINKDTSSYEYTKLITEAKDWFKTPVK
ncbi:hypothetical protein [Alkalibacterium gilvum]|uniref:hypothetical protein n=1 Tax=Alkalibacterium gilvum TaxID=1130080 RepID=UPI003F8E1AB9